jgi:hypothetical protein
MSATRRGRKRSAEERAAISAAIRDWHARRRAEALLLAA